MRSFLITTALTLIPLFQPTTSLSFPNLLQPRSPAIGPFHQQEPPTRNWARGEAKVALHHLLPAAGEQNKDENSLLPPSPELLLSLSSSSDVSKSIAGQGNGKDVNKLISSICDANAQEEFAKCYKLVKTEIEKSVVAYCGAMEGQWKYCVGREVQGGKEKGKECEEERRAWEGCTGFTHSAYAYCLTYSYSGLTSTIHCANTELSLLPATSPNFNPLDTRPLLALRAPAPAPAAVLTVPAAVSLSVGLSASLPLPSISLPPPLPVVATLSYYTNGSIAFYTTTMTLDMGPGPVVPSVTTTPAYRNSSVIFATTTNQGRNGSYISPTLPRTGSVSPLTTTTATTTSTSTLPAVSGYTSSGYTSSGYTSSGYTSSGYTSSGYTSSGYTSSGYTSSGYTSSGYTSSGSSLPTITSVSLSVNGSLEPSGTVSPVFGSGTRVGVFTTGADVCTRYIGVTTLFY